MHGAGGHFAADSQDSLSWPARVVILDGDLQQKVGHPAPGEVVPRAARWQNGWGFVLCIDGQVFYGFGVINPSTWRPLSPGRRSSMSSR